MLGKLFSLLLLGFPSVADAEVCFDRENSIVGCSFATGVLPSLESLGIPVADAKQHTRLGSTDKGKPYAEVNYMVVSEPMTAEAAAAVNEADLDELTSRISRELYRINCGHQMRTGLAYPVSFVMAGGVVSYGINVFLANEDGKIQRRLSFGETTIVSCGD